MGGLAVHFPIGKGTARRDFSLQERVRAHCSCACPWPPRPLVCLPAAQQCDLIGLNRVLPNQTVQVELDASLQREGRGLKLQFNRIDGVLRLREDD